MSTLVPAIILDSPTALTKDELDREWLADRTRTVEQGLMVVADAVVLIAKNWGKGRKVGRFHPGLTAFQYLCEEIGPIRLAREDRDEFIRKLVDAGATSREAGQLAGVSHATAQAAGRNLPRRRPEPNRYNRVRKSVSGILAGRATLPADVDTWLSSEPTKEERAAVAKELQALMVRVAALLERVAP